MALPLTPLHPLTPPLVAYIVDLLPIYIVDMVKLSADTMLAQLAAHRRYRYISVGCEQDDVHSRRLHLSHTQFDRLVRATDVVPLDLEISVFNESELDLLVLEHWNHVMELTGRVLLRVLAPVAPAVLPRLSRLPKLSRLVVSGHASSAGTALPAGVRELECCGLMLLGTVLPSGLRKLTLSGPTPVGLAFPESLTHLDVQKAHIASLPPLPSSLRVLHLGSTSPSVLPSLLTTLTLHAPRRSNTIPPVKALKVVIADIMPEIPTSVNTLIIRSHEGVPRLLLHLTHLDLAGCSLRSLPALNTLAHLVHMDASRNKLRAIPPLPRSLVRLRLAFNSLKLVQPEMQLLRRLYELDLSGNRLELPATEWNHLPRLLVVLRVALNTRHGPITGDAPAVNLSMLVRLRHLDLAKCRIRDLSRIRLPPVTVLALEHNSLSDTVLPSFPSTLRELYFSHTTRLPLAWLLPDALFVLRATNCRIREIPELPRHLVYLDLDHNRIGKVARPFPASLRHLSLTGNPVTDFDATFRFPVDLTLLVLQGTRIGTAGTAESVWERYGHHMYVNRRGFERGNS